MKMLSNTGPSTDPWGTSHVSDVHWDMMCLQPGQGFCVKLHCLFCLQEKAPGSFPDALLYPLICSLPTFHLLTHSDTEGGTEKGGG